MHAETVRLIYRLALQGDGDSGPMGVKTITKHLNEANIRTRDGGRWGIAAVHQVLTRTTYWGEHRFNTRDHRTRRPKPESEHAVMTLPPIVAKEEWEAVQAHLKSRSPQWTPARVVSGPTLLTGIAFCAACGGAMTLRTGKNGRYRYYTCSTRSRQGDTGCGGSTVPMAKLDTAVADHSEQRLLDPRRLTTLLAEVLDRRDDYIGRRRQHLAELRKRATEAEAKRNRIYEAIENGVADIGDPALKTRLTELAAVRDQAQAEAERAASAIERAGPQLTQDKVIAFAEAARARLRTSDGGYRRDHLRAVAQRIEVSKTEARILGSRTELLRTIAAGASVQTAANGVPTSGLKWRPVRDSNPCYSLERAVS